VNVEAMAHWGLLSQKKQTKNMKKPVFDFSP
jgi:hypothetical protein